MALPEFNVIPHKDPVVMAIQLEVRRAFQSLGPFARAKVLEDVALATVETRIRHDFGSVPQDWGVLSPSAFATIRQTRAPDATYLYIQSNVAVTVSLVVL